MLQAGFFDLYFLEYTHPPRGVAAGRFVASLKNVAKKVAPEDFRES